MTLEQFIAPYAAQIISSEEKDGLWIITCDSAHLRALLEAARPHFEYPEDLTCVDDGTQLRVIYRLCSMSERQTLHVQTMLPRTGGHLPTARDLWRGFEWQEREVFDLFGVRFEGHPDLRRILTWEGFDGHPLLKEFIVNDDEPWQIPEQTDREIIDLLLRE